MFNLLSGDKEYPMELHILAATLDPVSTRRPADKGQLFTQKVVPTHTFAAPPPQLDVIVVPGGAGCLDPNEEMVAFIRAVYPRLKYVLTICTGSMFLARAGVLDGRRATTNKAGFAMIAAMLPMVQWQPVARWIVDGNIWTASGVAAGCDATLAFIAEKYSPEVAEDIAKICEYEWHRDAAWDPFAVVHKVPGHEKGPEKA
jgi:transcriptional regulator GlxA family with amidase domain